MNKIIVSGNVGKDAEIKMFDSGKQMATFSIAVSSAKKDKDGNKITTWINCKCFGKLAEFAEKWVKKSSGFIVEGELSIEEYEKDGKKQRATYIIVSSFEFLPKKDSNTSAPKISVSTTESFDVETSNNDDDDLPF